MQVGVKADGWVKGESSPVIAHIVNEAEGVNYCHAYDANEQAALDVPADGEYEVSFIAPVNKDGSTYEVPEASKVKAGDVDGEESGKSGLPFEFTPVAADKASADTLNGISGDAAEAVKKGGEALAGEKGSAVIELVRKNIKANPNADEEKVEEADKDSTGDKRPTSLPTATLLLRVAARIREAVLFGFHDSDNFSVWQRGYFVERGLGRIEEAEEGGRKRRRYVGYDFHELRYTQATFLIGNGIDPKSVQERPGHEVSSMTMNVYAHMMGGNDREAADLMGKLLQTGGGGQEAPGEEESAGWAAEERAAAAPAEPVRFTIVGPNPDARPCPGAKLVEREVVRDGRTFWVEEWRVTVSSAAELLEIRAGRTRPSPSTGAGSPSWRGRLRTGSP